MLNNINAIVKATVDDLEEISQQIVDMVQESEGKVVHKKDIQRSMTLLFENDRLGAYFKNQLQTQDGYSNSGSFMLTWEWNIYQECCDWWFQSVYVMPNQRRTGVFRRMFQEIEKEAFKQNGSVKLYVECDNTVAIGVYEKMGMKRNKDVVYEDDFYFYPFKGELKLDASLKTELADINSAGEIIDFLGHSSSIYNYKLQTNRSNDEQIKFILEKTQYDGCILLTKHNEINTMMTSYFTEFSDWRYGLTIWIYDFRIVQGKQDDQDLMNLMIQNVLSHLKKLQLKLSVGCIRFIFDELKCPSMKTIMEQIGLARSHYYIYEKNQI